MYVPFCAQCYVISVTISPTNNYSHIYPHWLSTECFVAAGSDTVICHCVLLLCQSIDFIPKWRQFTQNTEDYECCLRDKITLPLHQCLSSPPPHHTHTHTLLSTSKLSSLAISYPPCHYITLRELACKAITARLTRQCCFGLCGLRAVLSSFLGFVCVLPVLQFLCIMLSVFISLFINPLVLVTCKTVLWAWHGHDDRRTIYIIVVVEYFVLEECWRSYLAVSKVHCFLFSPTVRTVTSK